MLAGWQRTRRISSREWLDYARAHLALLWAVLVLRLRSRGQLLAYDLEAEQESLPMAQLIRAGELERALSRAARYGVLRPKCLARSVALHRLLRGAGIRGSRIRIGVRPDSGGLTAHAWVTLTDRVLGDDPRFVDRFTEIADARMAMLT
jgi:hypothetical protein